MPLLYALRDELGLSNPRFGCGWRNAAPAPCMSTARPVRSCVTPVASVRDAKITTLAGLGTPEHPHPLQAAYVAEQVPQCGYCINGWIMTAAALLKKKPHPTDAADPRRRSPASNVAAAPISPSCARSSARPRREGGER